MSNQDSGAWSEGSRGGSPQALLEKVAGFYMGCLGEAEGAFEFLKRSGLWLGGVGPQKLRNEAK
jgi:hypothetical protein